MCGRLVLWYFFVLSLSFSCSIVYADDLKVVDETGLVRLVAVVRGRSSLELYLEKQPPPSVEQAKLKRIDGRSSTLSGRFESDALRYSFNGVGPGMWKILFPAQLIQKVSVGAQIVDSSSE